MRASSPPRQRVSHTSRDSECGCAALSPSTTHSTCSRHGRRCTSGQDELGAARQMEGPPACAAAGLPPPAEPAEASRSPPDRCWLARRCARSSRSACASPRQQTTLAPGAAGQGMAGGKSGGRALTALKTALSLVPAALVPAARPPCRHLHAALPAAQQQRPPPHILHLRAPRGRLGREEDSTEGLRDLAHHAARACALQSHISGPPADPPARSPAARAGPARHQ